LEGVGTPFAGGSGVPPQRKARNGSQTAKGRFGAIGIGPRDLKACQRPALMSLENADKRLEFYAYAHDPLFRSKRLELLLAGDRVLGQMLRRRANAQNMEEEDICRLGIVVSIADAGDLPQTFPSAAEPRLVRRLLDWKGNSSCQRMGRLLTDDRTQFWHAVSAFLIRYQTIMPVIAGLSGRCQICGPTADLRTAG
jgi:hypothetical protein